MIFDLPYIILPKRTGNMEDDVFNLLNKNGKENTATHCVRVAKTCADLAESFKLDRTIAYCSGILHDVSSIMMPADMLNYAENNNWYIDESERKFNFILHQRISEVAAKEYFGILDRHILSSVGCHSTLKANATEYDMLLFLSDKISWDQEGTPPFLDVVQDALNFSLMAASLAYINYVLDHNMLQMPHKWLSEAKLWMEQCRESYGTPFIC